MKRISAILLGMLVVGAAGCAAKYRTVMVPPRIDLMEHDIIAVVEFQSSQDGTLGPLATRRFTDLARRDQGLVRMLNVEPDFELRGSEAFRNLGKRHGAQTVLVGSLDISNVRPNLSVSRTLKSGSLTANVDATLTVDLIETETGASIWSASASATRTIGHITVFNGKDFSFDAEDPEQAYGPLIDALVGNVTSDFRASWVREPIPR